MLGTGKGCVKPPEIILEGSGVAPQHCFIERLNFEEEEVILHPISDLTTVDGIQVSGPTRLYKGNVIRVGDFHLLQYQESGKAFRGLGIRGQGSEKQEAMEIVDPLPAVDCPYAVVVKKKGASNHINTPGDVNNKNSFSSEQNTMETSTPSTPACHSNDNHDNLTIKPIRHNSFEEDYYDNSGNGGGDHLRQTQKYRDGLESDNFVNKLARFEQFTNQIQNPVAENGRFLLPSFPVLPERPNGFPTPINGKPITTDTLRRRPSPSFSRLGTGSEFRYFTDDPAESGTDGNANHILHSSKAVPTIGYRRAYSMSSTTSPYEPLSSFVRSNTIDESKFAGVRTPLSQNAESSQSCNSLSLLMSQSSPSPDSLYSSASSNSSFMSYGHYRATSTPVESRNGLVPKDQDVKEDPKFITYEELSDLRTKQTEGERHFSSRNIPSRGETSALDEVLAICEEYQQQIAREIEGKRAFQHTTQATTSEDTQQISRNDVDIGRPPSNDITKLFPGQGSRSDTGGEGSRPVAAVAVLPPRSLNLSNSRDIKRNMQARAEFFRQPEFPNHQSEVAKQQRGEISSPCSQNSHIDPNMRNGDSHADNFISYGRHVHRSPYENLSLDNLEKKRDHDLNFGQSHSLPTSFDFVDGPNPVLQNGHPPDLPPKSKLSVSFSPSVEEYAIDDYVPRVSSASSSPKSNTELTSRLKSPTSNASTSSTIVKTVATKVQIHSTVLTEEDARIESPSIPSSSENNDKTTTTTTLSSPIPGSTSTNQVGNESVNVIQFAELQNPSVVLVEDSLSFPTILPSRRTPDEHETSLLKTQIRDVEQQEMEALREMEMEKGLLVGEEQSMESQLVANKSQLEEMRNRLCQIDGGIRIWKIASVQELAAMKRKLSACERNLQRLEKLHEEFCGTADEETNLLEKLKYQHEQVEVERKMYEDAEFRQMEEAVDKAAQRDELTKLFMETKRKLGIKQNELEQLRNQNRVSLGSSVKEIQNLEKTRQNLLLKLQKCRASVTEADTLGISESLDVSSDCDIDEGKNCDLEEKLKSLSLLTSAADDAMTIELIKSNSPIDPKYGIFGSRTSETLREIEKYREYLLNEQGVQMLEEERQRVKELQKRVQAAVREEWEAAKRNRTNQCHSLNSVGSEDSSQTISDTPTDSGSSDDATDKSSGPSFGTTDGNSNGLLEQTSFELLQCQQMRHRQKDLSQSSSEDARPVSDASAYDDNRDGGTIVTLRDKHNHHRVHQNNRPLTRYLPVRGDEDQFDLRVHIESSGHQLSLCPHLVLTSAVAKGFLLKLGSRFSNWNKRWFVFDRETRTFSYYIDKSQKKPRGGIHFQAIQEVYVDHLQSVKSPSPKLTFCVKTYNRVFHLVAPSPEAMRIWVDIIFTGAEGYQEFKSGT